MAVTVWFLTLPGVMALDMTGPAETLRLAGPEIELRYIGPCSTVVSSTQMTISDIAPLPEQLPTGSLLIIPGVENSAWQLEQTAAREAGNWLLTQQAAIRRGDVTLVCICAGALLAARSGLLDGVACTTHHQVLDRLRDLAPHSRVLDNRVFIEDRGIWTSAGITTGIDLSLHLISRMFGPRKALEVAREMVVWFRRSGDDPQLSPWLRYRNHLHPAIHKVQDLISQHPEQTWPLSELADRVHISSRHLTRLFRRYLGISVHEYQQQLRVAVAGQRLQQGEGIEKAALAAGFSSARQFRRTRSRLQESSGESVAEGARLPVS